MPPFRIPLVTLSILALVACPDPEPETDTDTDTGSAVFECPDSVFPAPVVPTGSLGLFFGPRPEYIHSIQYLPFTPINELLLRPSWVAQSYAIAVGGIDDPSFDEGFLSYLVMAQGINEPAAAWQAAQDLTNFGRSNTKTNTLYWLATRP